MALLDIRERSGYLFLGVVLGHILLISAQISSRSGVPVLESVTFGIFSEVQRTLSGGVSGVRRVWNGYVGLRNLRAENEDLKRQLAAAQVAAQEQRALADRARGYQRLLELRDRLSLATTAAEIIGAAASPDFRTLTIDKGTRDGLRPDMAVIAPEGVVVGSGDDRLQMQYVSEASDLAVGDVLVTSGIDTIYPKGLVVGRVELVEKNGPAFKKIVVKPAVDFSRLEEVLVVLTPTAAKEAASGVSE